MLAKLRALPRDQAGATAVEYGLIAGIIVVGIMAAVATLGDVNRKIWDSSGTKVSTAVAGATN